MKNQTLLYFIILGLVLDPFLNFILYNIIGFGYRYIGNLLTILLVIKLFILKGNSLIIPKYIKLYFIFLIYTTIIDSIFVEDYNTQVIIKRFYGFSWPPLFYFVAFENINLSQKQYLNILKLIKLTLIAAIVVIIFQMTVDHNFFVRPSYMERWWDGVQSVSTRRLPSIYSWSGYLDTGLTFIPFLTLYISYLFLKKDDEIKIWIWFAGGFIFSFLTLARATMLNMVVIIFMVFVYKKIKLHIAFRYMIIVVILIFLSFEFLNVIGVSVDSIISIRVLEQDKEQFEEKSASTRVLAFQLFPELFKKSPIYGVGSQMTHELKMDLKGRSSQLHVGYLSLLYYYGIIGGILYFLFIFNLMKRIYQNSKKTKYWGPFFGWLSFLIANLTLNCFHPTQAGLMVSLIFSKFFMIDSSQFEFKKNLK